MWVSVYVHNQENTQLPPNPFPHNRMGCEDTTRSRIPTLYVVMCTLQTASSVDKLYSKYMYIIGPIFLHWFGTWFETRLWLSVYYVHDIAVARVPKQSTHVVIWHWIQILLVTNTAIWLADTYISHRTPTSSYHQDKYMLQNIASNSSKGSTWYWTLSLCWWVGRCCHCQRLTRCWL